MIESISITIMMMCERKCACDRLDESELTELRDPVASSLSLVTVTNKPPGVLVCSISVYEDRCMRSRSDILCEMIDLLATMAKQINMPGRHCGPCHQQKEEGVFENHKTRKDCERSRREVRLLVEDAMGIKW